MNSMNKKKYMIIDGIHAEIDGEKNILDIIRKIGIDLPTLCYYSDLSVYGACRMCVVEDKHGDILTSCSTPPRSGMDIKTNTPRLQNYRKMILELMLADHCRDCTTCERNYNCKLQEMAQRFHITDVRFDMYSDMERMDRSSKAIIRDQNKCILCGDCVRMCSEVQNVGALDFAYRGSDLTVIPAFDAPLAETNCVSCGQCRAVCPTGALMIKDDTDGIWKDIHDPNVIVAAQIAPAVRVALGDEFSLEPGTNVMGKTVAALKRMGFDEVYDTATGADLTVIEEGNEFLKRLKVDANLPLFTSCCPAWFEYAANNHPDMAKNVSSCKSPMEMMSSVLKERYRQNNPSKKAKKFKVVAIMPCTAKKKEITREELEFNEGEQATDYAITTIELAQMIRSSGLRFADILPEAVDMPFGIASGAGVIFGLTGGVTEAVIRYMVGNDDKEILNSISFTGVRGFEGLKEIALPYEDRELKIAVVSGLMNAEKLIQKIKSGELKYDFVEVMACPGGCISGAGQPFSEERIKNQRYEGMYEADRMSNVKSSAENPVAIGLYSGLLSGENAHKLLHYK